MLEDRQGDAVIREGKFGYVNWGCGRGRLLQSRQHPHPAPSIVRLLQQDAVSANGENVVFREKLERWPRFLSRKRRRIGRAAETFDGARFTFRPGYANQRAQIHERGVIRSGGALRQKLRGARPKHFPTGAGVDRDLDIEEAGKQASDVGFHDGDGFIERESGESVCGIAANTRKILDIDQSARKAAAMFFHHGDSRGAEITGAGVIAETLPGVQNVMFGSNCQSGEIGEALQPLFIIRDDGSDLRLLKHELRDEDGVRVVGVAPGKIAAVLTVPGEERTPE